MLIPETGINAGNATIVDTYTVAKTLSFPSNVNVVETGGYATVGDGGAALYKRLSADPVSISKGYFQDAGGVWWQNVSNEMSVIMFGAKPDAGVTNNLVPIQDAWDYSFAQSKNCYAPSGRYYTSATLFIPGDAATLDKRDGSITISGHAPGVPFAQNPTLSTVIYSTQNVTVVSDHNAGVLLANNSVYFRNIRIDGITTALPILRLYNIYGISQIETIVVYQGGAGHGVEINYAATSKFGEMYVYNKDYAAPAGLGAARTGIGVWLHPTQLGAGLVTFEKISSRGWLTGFQQGNSTADVIVNVSTTYDKCETSNTYNGYIIYKGNSTTISNPYMEGGDGGTGILNYSDFTRVYGGQIYEGFLKVIDDSAGGTTGAGSGSNFFANTIGLGAVVNAVAIDVTSTSGFQGVCTRAFNNDISRTDGIAGQIGVRYNGDNQSVGCFGNNFSPRTLWAGANAYRIRYLNAAGTSTPELIFGIGQVEDNNTIKTITFGGAQNLGAHFPYITNTDVSAGTLTLGGLAGYYQVAPTGAVNVFVITPGPHCFIADGAEIKFYLSDAQMVFKDSASLRLVANADFAGPGWITFVVRRAGANYFFDEQCRSTL